LDAENALLLAEQQYLQAIYDYLRSILAFEKALGKL
jgi:outer membrane protein TolC